ncbi:MAG: DUF58 domain-containing protein [Chlorobi bacterium]|nr:DUF58 domain-containing protein [Chlorobiota bacterium]
MPLLTLEDISQIKNVQVVARTIVAGFITGLHRSPYHGFSITFADHRPYEPGDDLRHLDWKLLARLKKKYTRRFEEETNMRVLILLDSSPSMLYPTNNNMKFKFSLFGAAALMYLLKLQRDAFSLYVIGQGTMDKPSIKPVHYRRNMGLLERYIDEPPNYESDIITALEKAAYFMPKRSLIVLFSDMLDKRLYENDQDFVDRLQSVLKFHRSRLNDVLIFHVFDSLTERGLKVSNTSWVKLKDVEMPSLQEEVSIKEIASEYTKAFDKWQKIVEESCLQGGGDYALVDIREPFAAILLKFLARRAKMVS